MNTDDTHPATPQDDGPGDGERIAKVLSRAGIASRRDAERLVLEGRVTVNGKKIDSPAVNVTPRDRLAVDGQVVGAPDATRLWLYHKPAGLVTTERDEEGRPTVFESLPEEMPRVMSVGRLDLTSEGLLLLTNDGEIKRRLELPSTGWLRRYRVRISGALSEEQLDELRAGITVDGLEYQPMEVVFDRQQGANAWLTVGLREGKNREIRRVMEHLGVSVSRLIRVSYGPFQLGNLPEGQVEEVRSRVLRDQLGLAPKPAPTRTRKAAAKSTAAPLAKDAAERPDREVLATPRAPGATVRRALKSRPVKSRAERAEEPTAPRSRALKPARGPAAPTGPFGKPRTWMRADEEKAAREAEASAPEQEDRPRRPRAVPGETKPRSAGFKSHGRPARSEGGEDRPRSAGFRSHKAEGDRPRPPRGEGERPNRPYKPREGGDDRPARPYKPRAAASEGGDRPARTYKPRTEGDRPARPYKPREGGDDRPARPYKPRGASSEGGDRPARTYKPREGGDDRPARPYKPREGGGADRPARSYKPREGDEQRAARPYKPRAAASEGGDRPARTYKPRTEGDRPARPYKPRESGDDRAARPYKPRPPRDEGSDRPARGFKPQGSARADGAPRPPRAEGARPPRPAGPGGERRGPSKGPHKPGRPAGPKPRKG